MRRFALVVLRVLARAVQVLLGALGSPHQKLPPSDTEERLRRRPDDYRP